MLPAYLPTASKGRAPPTGDGAGPTSVQPLACAAASCVLLAAEVAGHAVTGAVAGVPRAQAAADAGDPDAVAALVPTRARTASTDP